MSKKKIIAIYLPQFYPFKENDEWWGKGFTEWTNVTKARPRFKGHHQPHLPTDLGFYDLRLTESREAQATLAREYGIYGFCYYHYWFNGKRILEKPLDDVMESGKPDFPFMMCWANENWTRGWINKERDVLLKQEYSLEDDREHIRFLMKYFKDPRYIRINNKPVFAIYRSTIVPDMKATINIWREEAAKEGLELYLCRFESYGVSGESYLNDGFDAAIEFQPHMMSSNGFIKKKLLFTRFLNHYYRKYFKKDLLPMIFSYPEYVRYCIKQPVPSYKCYPCIMPGWDNSSRKRIFMAFKNNTPKLFHKWFVTVKEKYPSYSNEENLLFINAWNEWGEGCHLEPERIFGRGFLEALKEL